MSFFGTRRQAEPNPAPAPQRIEAPKTPLLQQPVGFETVLGANCTLEGTLESNANVRLDGAFTGTLKITGNILVGETAKINADINARNISIAGAVRGNVSGKKVQLLRTGRVWGDIQAEALTTEEGAFIDGRITMVTHEAAKSSNLGGGMTEAERREKEIDPHPVYNDLGMVDEAGRIDEVEEALMNAPAPVTSRTMTDAERREQEIDPHLVAADAQPLSDDATASMIAASLPVSEAMIGSVDGVPAAPMDEMFEEEPVSESDSEASDAPMPPDAPMELVGDEPVPQPEDEAP